MNHMRAALLLCWLASASAQTEIQPILQRISEEAEVFRRKAPFALAEETLQQKALRPRLAVRGRAPAGFTRLWPVQTRVIVSEYTLGVLSQTGAEGTLHEFRKVISVDGRPVSTVKEARQALSLGLRSPDERARKRLLEEFQRHGLIGAVTDFAPLILLFTRRGIGNYQMSLEGRSRVGGRAALVLSYRQTGGSQSLLIFQGRKVTRPSMQGQIFVRAADGLPLRITLDATRHEDGHTFRDHAAVEYSLSPHGFLTPVSVVHRGYVDEQQEVENVFGYSPFRLFTAEAEIKFTELPERP